VGPGAGLLCGQLFLRLRRKPVRWHSEVVTGGAAQRNVINGAVRAREGKAFRDLGGDAAIWARYGNEQCSNLPLYCAAFAIADSFETPADAYAEISE
jgi:hypothetical protein